MLGKKQLLGLSFILMGITPLTFAESLCQQSFNDLAQITPETLTEWAKVAAQGAYEFNYSNHAEKFESLKSCFTDAGWKSFQEALEQSNNMKVITSEKLNVTSSVKSTVSVTSAQANTWKIQVPLTVKFENNTRHMTQELVADLLVEAHANAEGQQQLGIAQFISKPADPS